MRIKSSKFAGSFYPADGKEIRGMITGFFKETGNRRPVSPEGKIKAIIVPHAGYAYSGLTAAFAYMAIKDRGYDKVIAIGPSHQEWFKGVAVCDYEEWQTPLGNIKLGTGLAGDPDLEVNNAAFDHEHSIEVQLPFLQVVLKDFTLYPFITGEISEHAAVADSIKKYIDENTLIVVSSDLSHYHPYEKAQIIDEETTTEVGMLKGIISHDQACGADGINILMHLARELNWKPELLDQRNSGDTAGEKDGVVGYAAFILVKY